MIYSTKTKLAMQLAYRAHAGQTDKAGWPYFHHPLHIAEQMKDEASTIVALLHDVVEDTDYKLEDIRSMGFGDDVTDALSLLTHEKSAPYFDYVAKIKENPIAKAVKLADLKHNSDLTRLDKIGEKDLARVEKYRKAIDILACSD